VTREGARDVSKTEESNGGFRHARYMEPTLVNLRNKLGLSSL
jgi:hypothetical protein